MKALSIAESREQLQLWGVAFRKTADDIQLSTQLRTQGGQFYKTCIDAFLGLDKQPFRFHRSKASLRQGLEAIAAQTEMEIRCRSLTADYQARADFYRTVACFFEETVISEQPKLFE